METNRDMAAPEGNNNGEITGHRAVKDRRYGLASSRLPKRYRFIDNRCDQMRRELEAVVGDQRGEVTIQDADLISAACDHERARQYLYARLRDCEAEGKPVPLQTAAQVMTTIGKCADARSRCIRSLDLDGDDIEQSKPWASPAFLTGPPTEQDDSSIAPEQNRASDGVSGVSPEE